MNMLSDILKLIKVKIKSTFCVVYLQSVLRNVNKLFVYIEIYMQMGVESHYVI